MGRISLTKLVLRNFRSFLGEHIIHLPASGLVILQGNNLDSGGESGAGKSAVLHAVAYAFGYAPYSAKALQNWDTEDPMSVEVHMDTPKGTAVLTRGEKLQLIVGGLTYKGSAKHVETALDELCGVNPALRAALTYRGQKRPGLFLSMTDAEKKEFFVDVLKLHWAEEAVDKAAKAILAREKDEQVQVASLAAYECTLAFAQASLPEVRLVDTAPFIAAHAEAVKRADDLHWEVNVREVEFKNVQQWERTAANNAQEAFEPRIRELEAQIRAEQAAAHEQPDMTQLHQAQAALTDCRERRSAVVAADAARRKQYDARVLRLSQSVSEMHHKLSARPTLEAESEEIKRQMASIAAAKCPTCEQSWQDSAAKLDALHDRLHELNLALSGLQDTRCWYDAVVLERDELEPFEPDPLLARFDLVERQIEDQLASAKRDVAVKKAVRAAETNGRIAKLQVEVSNLKAQAALETAKLLQADGLSAGLGKQLQELRRELHETQMKVQALDSERRRIEQQNEAEIAKRAHAERQLEAAQQAVAERQRELAEVRGRLNAERDFHAMVKGFLNAIFDEILAEITDETNATLGSLPNVAHMTIRFVSDYQTQKGTTKQAIVPIASFNGDEHPLLSGCSGGMETSVELAVDLAVGRVVSRRTGSDLGWLILDESFTGHDQVTKESCLDVLARYSDDKLVLIVDHGSEAKEMFTQRIQVEYRNGRSALAKENA